MKQPHMSPYNQIVQYDLFHKYLAEIKKIPLLDRKYEKKLAIRYRLYNDKKAACILIKSNLLFVVKIVREFHIQQQNIMDYIQEGNIGLMEALKRFDPYRNIRFSTYARWWIKAYIFRYIIENWRFFKIGTTNKKKRLFFNLHKEKVRLETLGISPDAKMLAENLDSSEREINIMISTMEQQDLSLDSSIEKNNGTALSDILWDPAPSVEDQVARKQLQNIISVKIKKFKKGISCRERLILEERLMNDKPATLKELSTQINKTRETVRYSEKKLVKKLKFVLYKEIPDIDCNIVSL